MQFGIFTVGDVTAAPTNRTTPTEHERIKAMVAVALKAEVVGLDVFATGEHHNPPFVPSSPTARYIPGSAKIFRRVSTWPWRTMRCCAGCGARTWWTGKVNRH